MDIKNNFPKGERLCSRKAIEALFTSGSRGLSAFPLRAIYKIERAGEDSSRMPVQLLISVSKRHFRHAVDRNRAKRQLREAWRLNRDLIHDHLPADIRLNLAFIWLADELQPSDLIHRKVRNLLHRVQEQIEG